MSNERMRDLLALAQLKRWNVVPTNRDQTVGEHSFRVAVIAWEIAQRYNNIPDRIAGTDIDLLQVLMKAISHDGPECLTGDLPSNLKKVLEDKGVRWFEIETELCPWIKEVEANFGPSKVVQIADKIESAGWLKMYGTEGTWQLVNELELKAHKLCFQVENNGFPGMLRAGMDVAGEVWKNEWPVLYQNNKREVAANGGNRR